MSGHAEPTRRVFETYRQQALTAHDLLSFELLALGRQLSKLPSMLRGQKWQVRARKARGKQSILLCTYQADPYSY